MVVVAVAARHVHDPAEEDGEEDEGDERADQRPVHGENLIREPSGRASSMQGDLLGRGGERPRHLQAPLLAEDEP